MECVDYDDDFQRQLCDKFPLWVPPPKQTRGSGKSSPKKSKLAGRKRKREVGGGNLKTFPRMKKYSLIHLEERDQDPSVFNSSIFKA